LIVKTIKVKKNQPTKMVKEGKEEEHTSPGRVMKYSHEVIHQLSEASKLCFMVNNEGSSYDSVSDYSTDSESYDQLLIGFKETHDEANKLLLFAIN